MILNHVLEHIVNPIETLISIRELLKENGILYIEVPTLESIETNYNYDIFTYLQSAHIYNFSNNIFKQMITSSGFNIIKEYENIAIVAKKSNTLSKFIINEHEYIKNINQIKLMEYNYNIYNKILYEKNIIIKELEYKNIQLNSKIDNIVNSLAWWIPIKKWRDNFRNKILNTDQTRPDQTRPDQTRPNTHM